MLECMEQVSLSYVSAVNELGEPDMILLPGTKNTMSDLKWLRESGLEPAILRAKERGCIIFGICGGYQMLGELLLDPYQVEEGGKMRGMGLLPVETTFTKEKTRTRVTGVFETLTGALAELSGMELEGYEIHMGLTKSTKDGGKKVARLAVQAQSEGAEEGQHQKSDGCHLENVYGTYVHGIFDGEGIAQAFVKILAKKKGIVLETAETMDRWQYKEKQYDILADTMRRHLNMEKIYEILEQGVEA